MTLGRWIRVGVFGMMVGCGPVLIWRWNKERAAGSLPSPESSNGVARCERAMVDLGKFYRPAPEKYAHCFRIRNVLPRSIGLKIVSKSCSCTEVRLSRSDVGPGEDAELTVKWDLPRQYGEHKFGVVLATVPAGRGYIRLGGKAQVTDCLVVSPTEISLGSIRPQETRICEIDVTALPGETILEDLLSVPTTYPADELRLLVRRETARKATVEVTVTGKPHGHGIYRVTLRTGNKAQPEIEIPIRVDHLGAYEAQPAIALFGRAQGDSDKRCIRLISNTNTGIVLDRVDVDDPNIMAIQVVQGGPDVSLELRRLSPLGQPTRVGTIRAFVKDQDEPILIRYMCF